MIGPTDWHRTRWESLVAVALAGVLCFVVAPQMTFNRPGCNWSLIRELLRELPLVISIAVTAGFAIAGFRLSGFLGKILAALALAVALGWLALVAWGSIETILGA